MEFLINAVISTLVSAGVLFLASKIINGIDIDGWGPAIVGAVVTGLANKLIWTFLAPILLPLTVITLGLAAFAVNAFVLKMTAAVVRGFEIRSFGAAMMGALTMALIHLVIGFLFGT